jgi:uncharacterized protein (TIGR03437 family)
VGWPDGHVTTVPASVESFPPSVTGLAQTFYQYQADLSGLKPGASYAYRITQNGATLNSGSEFFSTAAPGNVSFLVFGDSGQDTPQQIQIAKLMQSEPGVSFLVHTGDLTYPTGTFGLYDGNYFGLNASLFGRLPVFPTPGNHDYMADNAAAFVAAHSLPASGVDPADLGRYYSFEWGEIHFSCVDSNLLSVADASARMLAWLDRDLAAARKFWKIVLVHHAPYPTGHHLGDPLCVAAHQQINPLAERYGVQLVLAGHEHGYERTVPLSSDQPAVPGFGTTYVISGGGGADLHNVNPGGLTALAMSVYHYLRIDVTAASLTLRATDLNGGLIEKVTIAPQPSITAAVSAGDFGNNLAPGSLMSIFGQNFAVQSQAAGAFPLPTQLGGIRVQLDSQDIPLLFVSPGQINTQIPYNAAAKGVLRVVTANGAAETQISTLATAPSILAVTLRDALVSASNKPSSGDTLVIYATGLGAVRQAVAAGASVAGIDLAQAPVDVWLGSLRISPSYAGLCPGFAGLYQVNFTIPPGTATGSYPLRLATADASSRTLTLPVS